MEGSTVSEIYDLAVLGGGPAGTSAAITAAKMGWRVLLLEAGTFPRHKVCGEFVSGEALSILESFIGQSDLFTGAPRISKTRIFLDDHIVEFPVSPAALSISRCDLDCALWNHALESGVCARDRCTVKEARRDGESFAIIGERLSFRARTVIDATGRWSRLRIGKPTRSENWIGIKAHFHEGHEADFCDLYFFPAGYCGVQPLGNGRVNAAAMVRAEAARTLNEVFALSPALERRARTWRHDSETVTTAPLFFSTPSPVQREMALIGDAAAFIDPFAGDGISIALHSGRLAAAALSMYLRAECPLVSALEAYDREYRAFIAPALRNAARLRWLLQLPKPGRITALTLLTFPMLARFAVAQTRVRASSSFLQAQPA